MMEAPNLPSEVPYDGGYSNPGGWVRPHYPARDPQGQWIPSHIDRDDYTYDPITGRPILNPPELVPDFWDKYEYSNPHSTTPVPELEFKPNPFDKIPPYEDDFWDPGYVNPPNFPKPPVAPPPQWWDPSGLGRRPMKPPMDVDPGPDPDGPRPFYPRMPRPPYDGPYIPDIPPTGPGSIPPYQTPVIRR